MENQNEKFNIDDYLIITKEKFNRNNEIALFGNNFVNEKVYLLMVEVEGYDENDSLINTEVFKLEKISGSKGKPKGKRKNKTICFGSVSLSREYAKYKIRVVRIQYRNFLITENEAISLICYGVKASSRKDRFSFYKVIAASLVVLLGVSLYGITFNSYQKTREDLSNYRFSIVSGEMTITNYIGTDDNIFVPRMIQGQLVTKVGDYAFSGTRIKTIEFSNVVDIGEGAFSECLYLKYVDFDHIDEIGKYAFYDCVSLENYPTDK